MCERLDELTIYFRKVCGNESDDEDMYWITRNRRRIHIPDMKNSHLVNTLRYIQRRAWQFINNHSPGELNIRRSYHYWRSVVPICTPQFASKLPKLEEEAKKRDISDWEYDPTDYSLEYISMNILT